MSCALPAHMARTGYGRVFLYCLGLAAALFAPHCIVDALNGGFFHYAGDFNDQMIDRIRVLQKSRFLDVEAVKRAPKPQNFFERKWEAFTLNWLPYLWRARDTLLRRRVTPRAATSGWQTGNYPGGEGDG